MHNQSIDAPLASYRLWRQALSGDSDRVLLALEEMDSGERGVLGADLLARLYVRAGRIAEARMLWKRILDADPNYPPALRALAKLDSRWLIWAVVKRYSSLFGLAWLFLFGLYGLGGLFIPDEDSSFALVGVSTILAVLGVYLGGLFRWFYRTVSSMTGSGQDVSRHRIQPQRDRELSRLHADAMRIRR